MAVPSCDGPPGGNLQVALPLLLVSGSMPWICFIAQMVHGAGQALGPCIRRPPRLRVGLMAADPHPSPTQSVAGLGPGSCVTMIKALVPSTEELLLLLTMAFCSHWAPRPSVTESCSYSLCSACPARLEVDTGAHWKTVTTDATWEAEHTCAAGGRSIRASVPSCIHI